MQSSEFTKLTRIIECLKQNDADYLFDVLPIVLSIFLFGLSYRLGNTLFWENVWLTGVSLSALFGGLWRTVKSGGKFQPAVAAIFGIAIGFAAASGPATVYAATADKPIPISFHMTLAALSMCCYAVPPMFWSMVKLIGTAELLPKESISKRTRAAMLVLAVALLALQVFFIIEGPVRK